MSTSTPWIRKQTVEMALLSLFSKLKETEHQKVSHHDPRLGQLFQTLSAEERVHEKEG